jgi:DNA-binding winged helix-turn-helix (wHTH) protein
MLLERPGEMVTREELQQKLWPSGTFVDFDHNLNSAINKIREALGDSAENPRFVETLARRGYRFIAPVQKTPGRVSDDTDSTTVETSSDNSTSGGKLPVEPPRVVSQDFSTEAATPKRSPISRRWGAAAAVALLVLLGALIFWLNHPLPVPKVIGSFQITNDGQQKVYAYDYDNTMVTDGSRLYFSGSRQVSIGGGQTTEIPVALEYFGIEDISPNRTELLIRSTSSATIFEGPIWILPLPAGSLRRVGEIVAHAATWSKGGQQITYAFGKELYLAKSDGTESHKLVSLPGNALFLRWSADGSRLRFTLQEYGKASYSLWEVQADGTDLHPLLPGWNNPAAECCGNWTADGKYFVFQSSRGGLPGI